tara:strand:+ start:1651 stop:2814 length:1164 start_codon:yes stop_codon:yes gene_type:complete
MYDVLLGKQRGLVFPVMCNGGVVIDYHDNVPSYNSAVDDAIEDIAEAHIGYGLWANEGSFTLESIITPYEINGYGKISTASQPTIDNNKKIMPSNNHQSTNTNYQSERYLPIANRLGHEMTIFSNYDSTDTVRFWFGLVNSTLHNENQPAEYKLRARMTINNVTETFDSPICIQPNYLRRFKYNTDNLQTFDEDGMGGYRSIGSIVSHTATDFTADGSGFTTTNLFGGGRLEVFYRSGFGFESLGLVSTSSSSSITISSSFSETLVSGSELFIRSYAEPTYINDTFHVACVFNSTTNSITFYINGNKMFSNKHTETTTFTFAPNDCKIGQAFSHKGYNTATINKQFMGEIHEMSMMDIPRKNFVGTFNLLPNYENTLFYYRFEEVDL